jgi:hypothetical protein
LGIEPSTRLSPLLEKCCLLLSANESYQNAQQDLSILTGIKVGHSTFHRKVNQVELPDAEMKQGLSEIAVDGGKVRLRSEVKGEPSYWQDYKTARLQGLYYGAFFQSNLCLSDWINSQPLTSPIYCLGDGHDGVWNIFEEIGEEENRVEILDWYHLRENLYKIEAQKSILEKLEGQLWAGQVSEAISLLERLEPTGGKKMVKYLQKHRYRVINYEYCQREKICSIGSGAVESGVKQISQRIKLTGAQWKKEDVNKILQLRCAYLNGKFALLA